MYEVGKLEEPESWKDKFFVLFYSIPQPVLLINLTQQDLREEEAKRLEMLGAKLRNKRVEHEERKKEREVKLTDRLPPSKRQRACAFLSPPSAVLVHCQLNDYQGGTRKQPRRFSTRLDLAQPNYNRAFTPACSHRCRQLRIIHCPPNDPPLHLSLHVPLPPPQVLLVRLSPAPGLP
jgi:hypothetical protein